MSSKSIVLIASSMLTIAWSLVPSEYVSAQEQVDKAKPGEKPDIVLYCHSWDQIWVSKGDVDQRLKRWPGVSPESIKEVLKDKKPKDRIDIWFEKSIDWRSPSEAAKVKAFEDYAMTLGYKETTITGCTAFFPIPVIFDSALGGHQKPAEMVAPIIVLPGPSAPSADIKPK